MSGTVLIRNPKSGDSDRAERVRSLAAERGYALERTEEAGDAIELATAAARRGAHTIVACGGDGTVNEVVRGIDRAEAFDDVTLGILPLGTGNNFAKQIGIPDLETAISVLEDGERRRIDLGRANDRPVVNSCVAGLTANASHETDPALKRQFGVLAYVITALRSIREFESLRLTIDAADSDAATSDWTGEALAVLVGNGRRFTAEGDTQADMEDGHFDVTVVRDVSTLDLTTDLIVEQLFGRDSADIVRTRTPALTITNHDPDAIRFSLDGEILRRRELSLAVRPRTLRVAVGSAYDPSPT